MTTPYALTFTSLLATIAVSGGAWAVNKDIATLETRNGVSTLTVESSRPVAKAVETLVAKYGTVITYEDPRYEYTGDLEDATARVRTDLNRYPSGQAPKVIVPLGGKLSVSSSSTDMSAVLKQIVQASDHGHFRVEQAGNIFHVVPTEKRDRDGNWLAPSSILDVSISLPEQDRTAYGTIKAICQAVSAAAHVHVGVGTGVWSGGLTSDSGPVEYRLGANNEHARSVLLRALAILTPPNANTKQTWLLFYGSPQDPSYALNLMAVPGPPLKEPPAPAPPAPQPGSPSVSSVK